MRPVLDPERDLKGATPEELARALFQPSAPRRRTEPIIGNEVGVEQVPADHTDDGVTHLREGV